MKLFRSLAFVSTEGKGIYVIMIFRTLAELDRTRYGVEHLFEKKKATMYVFIAPG